MTRVVVVGAGIAGLLCARDLAAHGHTVTVLDKGRSPGGRLATRRIGAATLDHGAQFFTVRTDRFAGRVLEWERDGLVREWCRGFGAEPDGFPRYAVRGGMNALAKHVARGLDVQCEALAFAVRAAAGRWDVTLGDGSVVGADALVLTPPLPQSGALLVTSGVSLPERLRGTDYDRTLALLAVLDGPSAVPAPGGVQEPAVPFAFVGDNAAKGVSAVPAVTFHATPAFSEERWDTDRDEVHAELLEAARPWLGGGRVVASHVKRWRFATPRAIWPERCHPIEQGAAPLVLAGDAFGGPRVEGAALSGLAAAEYLR
jgi:predicted NAD/FAD-dependent oxidoreductase